MKRPKHMPWVMPTLVVGILSLLLGCAQTIPIASEAAQETIQIQQAAQVDATAIQAQRLEEAIVKQDIERKNQELVRQRWSDTNKWMVDIRKEAIKSQIEMLKLEANREDLELALLKKRQERLRALQTR